MVQRSYEAAALVNIVLRSLLAAAFITSIAWILLPPFFGLYRHTLGNLLHAFRQSFNRYRQRQQQREASRRLASERRLADQEWQRSAGQREQQRIALEQQAREQAVAQKRRDDARTKCRLLYDSHAPEISERFGREQFESYVTQYLNDKQTADYVEERAQQLKQLIQQHLEKVDPTPKVTTLAELRRWFEERKAEIEAQPDERLQRNLMARLQRRYADLATQLLEELPP
jgi:molybdopterin converting factor small subunit